MLSFNTAKLVAVAGLLLMLVSPKSLVLGVAAMVLYLLGMHSIASAYRENRIFTYALYASIAVYVALAAIALTVGIGVLTAPFTGGVTLGLAVIFALAIFYAGILATGYYKKRLLQLLRDYSDSGLADLAGKLYWYGAILTIILVGAILVFIAGIFEIIVVATLKEPHATRSL